jgi:hypothetical protein
MESQVEWKVARLPLPPPVQTHLIQLLAQRLYVGIGKPRVQRADVVRVVTRATHFVIRVFSHRIDKKTGFTGMGSVLYLLSFCFPVNLDHASP